MRAFERQEGETHKAYQAFQKYLELGPERTLAKAADAVYGRSDKGPRQHAPGKIREWAQRFEWHERAQAWDDLLQMERLEGAREAEREKAHDLATRNQKLDEDILALKEEFVPKLKQMVQWPLARTEHASEDGKEVTRLYPARWSFNTVVNALGVLKDADGEGLSVNVNLGMGEPPNFSALTDEELEVYERINEKLRDAQTLS